MPVLRLATVTEVLKNDIVSDGARRREIRGAESRSEYFHVGEERRERLVESCEDARAFIQGNLSTTIARRAVTEIPCWERSGSWCTPMQGTSCLRERANKRVHVEGRSKIHSHAVICRSRPMRSTAHEDAGQDVDYRGRWKPDRGLPGSYDRPAMPRNVVEFRCPAVSAL